MRKLNWIDVGFIVLYTLLGLFFTFKSGQWWFLLITPIVATIIYLSITKKDKEKEDVVDEN